LDNAKELQLIIQMKKRVVVHPLNGCLTRGYLFATETKVTNNIFLKLKTIFSYLLVMVGFRIKIWITRVDHVPRIEQERFAFLSARRTPFSFMPEPSRRKGSQLILLNFDRPIEKNKQH